jgi:hypothetical protein
MSPTNCDWKKVIQWFEFTPLCPDDLTTTVRRLNRFLSPEGHFAHLLEDEGYPCIGIRVHAENPALAIERLLRENGMESTCNPLDHPSGSVSERRTSPEPRQSTCPPR